MIKKIQNTVAVFEDELSGNFFPLTYFRPIFNLKTGIFSLRDKIFLSYKNVNHAICCRKILHDYMSYRNPKISVNKIETENVLFINGRVIADESFSKQISIEGEEVVFVCDKNIVAIRSKGKNAKEIAKVIGEKIPTELIKKYPIKKIDVKFVKYIWDLISSNGNEIVNDSKYFAPFKIHSEKIHSSVSFINQKNISIGKGTTILPNVVIDATLGPVIIGENVFIHSQSTIIGPTFIGSESIIKIGAKIYQNNSIGTMSKIGGELEGNIIHGYSNKQHDGFLGHSYVGAWVNLGANTTNSDLKNNYGNVKIFDGKHFIDTGQQFLGSIIGDHVKTSINTTLNTGTVIGVSSNIFGDLKPPKFVPSFSWGLDGAKFEIDKAIEVGRNIMSRRKIKLTKEGEELFRKIYKQFQKEK